MLPDSTHWRVLGIGNALSLACELQQVLPGKLVIARQGLRWPDSGAPQNVELTTVTRVAHGIDDRAGTYISIYVCTTYVPYELVASLEARFHFENGVLAYCRSNHDTSQGVLTTIEVIARDERVA